jgi:hypothetical protein
MVLGFMALAGAGQLAAQSRPELLKGVQELSTVEQTKEWFTYYYLHPRPDLLPSALDVLSQDGALNSRQTAGTMVAFISQLCAANPDKVSFWAATVGKRSQDQRVVMEAALWIANSVESRLALSQLATSESAEQKKAINQMLSQPPPDLLQGEIDSPAVVDALWGSFYANGDARFVTRVISLLPMLSSADPKESAIARAAESSLTSNAIGQTKVMEICESRVWSLPSAERAILSRIIQRAKEARK